MSQGIETYIEMQPITRGGFVKVTGEIDENKEYVENERQEEITHIDQQKIDNRFNGSDSETIPAYIRYKLTDNPGKSPTALGIHQMMWPTAMQRPSQPSTLARKPTRLFATQSNRSIASFSKVNFTQIFVNTRVSKGFAIMQSTGSTWMMQAPKSSVKNFPNNNPKVTDTCIMSCKINILKRLYEENQGLLEIIEYAKESNANLENSWKTERDKVTQKLEARLKAIMTSSDNKDSLLNDKESTIEGVVRKDLKEYTQLQTDLLKYHHIKLKTYYSPNLPKNTDIVETIAKPQHTNQNVMTTGNIAISETSEELSELIETKVVDGQGPKEINPDTLSSSEDEKLNHNTSHPVVLRISKCERDSRAVTLVTTGSTTTCANTSDTVEHTSNGSGIEQDNSTPSVSDATVAKIDGSFEFGEDSIFGILSVYVGTCEHQ